MHGASSSFVFSDLPPAAPPCSGVVCVPKASQLQRRAPVQAKAFTALQGTPKAETLTPVDLVPDAERSEHTDPTSGFGLRCVGWGAQGVERSEEAFKSRCFDGVLCARVCVCVVCVVWVVCCVCVRCACVRTCVREGASVRPCQCINPLKSQHPVA